ncbi:MAG: peptide chain release factor N(5)-glutamine methyltransferase [Phycisphaerae bacterium]
MSEQTEQANGDWTIGRLLDWTRRHFDAREIEDARLCAELLLAEALGCRRIELYTRFGDVPAEAPRAAYRELVKAAAAHRPIAYLIGRKEFYSLDFLVTPDVLIPRPETELLVEHALGWCSDHPLDSYALLDIGTGSGCIAVTIARRNEAVHAVATDISAAALKVARQNAERHGVSDRVRFVQADMLDPPRSSDAGFASDCLFDIIVSNPPYVAVHERETLPKNVRDYEPEIALFCGADGLDAYRRIAEGVRGCLKPGGALLLEIGEGRAEAVTALFTETAGLEFDRCHKDLAGTDRALQFTLPA